MVSFEYDRVSRAVTHACRTVSILILAGASLLACGGDRGGTSGQPPAGEAVSNPIGAAYEALVAANHEALPQIIAALDESVARDPNDAASAFYAGVMRLWRLTRARPDRNRDLAQMALDARDAVALLETATALRPESEHAAAFLGIAQVGIGAFVGDEVRIEQGRQILDGAVPLNPAYVHGVRALVFGALPRAHPLFQQAIDGVRRSLEACGSVGGGEQGLTFAYAAGPLPSAQRVCNDSGIVAHVWEGLFLTFGDILVKQGEADKARAAYENAKASPAYDTWLLREPLEERIAQAGARADLYLDDDATNDPLTWMEEDRICVGCHASAY